MFNRDFPQGIAEGDAFLGRVEESARLSDNLQQGRHTLLLSPRRYGKTSLARHTIKKRNSTYTEIDLFLAIDERSIETRFLNGIEELIQKIYPVPQQWLNRLVNFFKQANKTWTIGFTGLKLELKPDNHDDIAGNLLLAFKALEHLLIKKQKTTIIFVDEFQEINKIPAGKLIEGSIRHFAQAAKNIVFIFSGSNRHMLVDIFGDRTRPLYALCDWLSLARLTPDLYQKYINKIAKKTWGEPLSTAVFTEMITLTECHPEATYGLCANLWQYCRQKNRLPTADDVQVVWQLHIKEHLKQTRINLSQYSSGQLKVLILIAVGFNKILSGKVAQRKLDLTSPSILSALSVLENHDLVEKQADGSYHLIDPVMRDTLINYYSEYLDD